MSKLKFIVPFFIFFLSFSCSSSKYTGSSNAEEMKTASIINRALALKPVFTHLTIQSKINADIDGNSVGLNGKIYIQDGQKIWINISKFGITAARAIVTPNGFKGFEKLNRTYVDGDFSYFNNLLKVDFIDYGRLQNLLLGRIFIDIKANEFNSELVDNSYVLTYKQNDDILRNPKEGEYIQTYKLDSDLRLKEAILIDPTTKIELTVTYENWNKIGTQYFPKNVKVLVKDKKPQKVELEYNNFTFEQSETPFEIPSGYKPNDLLK